MSSHQTTTGSFTQHGKFTYQMEKVNLLPILDTMFTSLTCTQAHNHNCIGYDIIKPKCYGNDSNVVVNWMNIIFQLLTMSQHDRSSNFSSIELAHEGRYLEGRVYNGFIFFHIISWSLGAGTSLEENAALVKKKVSYLLCISYIFSSKLANDATSIIKMHNIFWETSYCQSWLVKLNGLVKINIVFCLCHIGFIWTQYVLWK